ncbi:glycosyltransferase [Desulfovibrio sp. OttesenSCG-928-I05]|nr:glycosyltransferase [Desulfovibrio sp. OttesenSCG-928-I05]
MRLGFLLKGEFVKDMGGLDAFQIEMVNEMGKRGHESVLFSPALQDRSRAASVRLHPAAQHVTFAAATPETFHDEARACIVQHGVDLLCVMYAAPFPLHVPRLMNATGIPVILSEHIAPGAMNERYWMPYERHACLAAADAIHMIFDEFSAELPAFLRERTTVIPLPAEQGVAIDWTRRETAPRKTLITAGRLVEGQKNHSLLIKAFLLLADTFPDWDLCLYGDGPDKARYEAMAANSPHAARISFPGWIADLAPMYEAASLFCIPSLSEAFGLATVEAQRFALPAVGFAASPGTNSIIRDGVNGRLAPETTPESLAETLAPLMASPEQRRAMGIRGQELLSRFEPKAVFDAWEALFTRTAAVKGQTRLLYPPFSEEDMVMNALHEILARDVPEIRPACVRQERRIALIEAGAIRPKRMSEL